MIRRIANLFRRTPRRIHHRSTGPVRLDPDVREVVDVVGTY